MQRLPPETLMYIFVHTRPTLTHFDWVRNIMVVCRRWKSILVRTPQFWADLIGDSSWDLYGFTSERPSAEIWPRFTFAVSHSGTLPLYLYLTCVDAQAVDFLIPHRCRIATLAVSQKSPSVSLARFISAPFPILGRLSLASVHVGMQRPDFIDQVPYARIDPALLPGLCSLELPGRHFAQVGPFRSLRHLTLMECRWLDWCSCSNQSSTLSGILDALEQCQQLETLALRGLPDTDTDDSDLRAVGRVVRLAGLRDLHIEDTPRSVVAFFDHLVIPATTSLYLTVDPGDGTFMDLLTQNVKTIMLAACGAELVRFRGVPWSCTVEIHGAHGQVLRITERRLLVEGYGRQLLQVANLFSHVPRVEVQLYGNTADDTVLRRAWFRFKHLRSFEMIGCDARLHLLPFMASPEGREALRTLEHLCITWDCKYDERFFPNLRKGQMREGLDLYAVKASGEIAPLWPMRYNASACEAFCDIVAPLLASEPFSGSIQSLIVLMVSQARDEKASAAVDNIMRGRLGRLGTRLNVLWYY
ncbi:hypothetical protein L226DRAFT_253803 [Lentinus tigrinus ALCF2SS1-7]|uniref:F-box domain-containing protein n=1 Tax=Lentinus tigrinus ALCF2SS1-6 TaxID=1328759 RepID=A0A5C2RZK4_9APHY|nr:hypothetical protein L227DRAFT_614390 [Lentinus tigrinus ALCF2SS1-6]RPD79588.1 hypothetical protein L226DRAFT_253803 [Lentinus tigrinus ALCF2SS1-7]